MSEEAKVTVIMWPDEAAERYPHPSKLPGIRLYDLGKDRGLPPEQADAEISAVVDEIKGWSRHVLNSLLWVWRGDPDAHVSAFAYLVHFDALPRTSRLVTPPVLEALAAPNDAPRSEIIHQLQCATDSVELRSHYWARPGLTDDEVERWATEIQKLPRGLWQVLDASSDGVQIFELLHELGISDRGRPTAEGYVEDTWEIVVDPQIDDDPIGAMRRALWKLHDGRPQPDTVTHAQVEAALGKLMHLSPLVIASLAKWAASAPARQMSTFLVHIGAAELGGPFASDPMVIDNFDIPLVRASNGASSREPSHASSSPDWARTTTIRGRCRTSIRASTTRRRSSSGTSSHRFW